MSTIQNTLSTCLRHLTQDLKHRQYGESICLLQLPQHFHPHVKVVGFQDDAITIAITDACWLHPLRHHERNLQQALVQAGYTHIQKVHWRINPKISNTLEQKRRPTKVKRHISDQTIDVVAQAAQCCTGEKTKQQLQRLLKTLRNASASP